MRNQGTIHLSKCAQTARGVSLLFDWYYYSTCDVAINLDPVWVSSVWWKACLRTTGVVACGCSDESSLCQYTLMKRLFSTASVLCMARLASSGDANWIRAPSGSLLYATLNRRRVHVSILFFHNTNCYKMKDSSITCRLTMLPNLLKCSLSLLMLLSSGGICLMASLVFGEKGSFLWNPWWLGLKFGLWSRWLQLWEHINPLKTCIMLKWST